ncbi:MAG: hypothetical protein WC876_08670 [Candidatus Thermoplasmatota archaeon]|jgi:hypothetical protein
MNKLRSTILVGAAVLAVALLLAPTVAAQGTATAKLQVTVKAPTAPIKPQIDNPTFSVDYTYTFDNNAFTPSGVVTANVVIQFPFQCTNGVLITGPQSVVKQVATAPAATSGTAQFQISIPRTAPGLQNLQCTLKAKADSLNAATPATTEQNYPFTVTADYYSLNQVKVATKLKQSGPQKQVPFEMEVTNFGNARTQYLFELAAKPDGDKWSTILPEVLLLESPNSGAGSPTNTAIFTVATPYKNGWNNLQGSYQILIKPSAADDPTKEGNPLTANMLVRVRGVYVPGLEPTLMLGALLGSALLLRLRKDEE